MDRLKRGNICSFEIGFKISAFLPGSVNFDLSAVLASCSGCCASGWLLLTVTSGLIGLSQMFFRLSRFLFLLNMAIIAAMINLIVFLTSSIMTAIIFALSAASSSATVHEYPWLFSRAKGGRSLPSSFRISLKLLEATLLAAKLALSCGPPAMFNVLFGVPFGAFGYS